MRYLPTTVVVFQLKVVCVSPSVHINLRSLISKPTSTATANRNLIPTAISRRIDFAADTARGYTRRGVEFKNGECANVCQRHGWLI